VAEREGNSQVSWHRLPRDGLADLACRVGASGSGLRSGDFLFLKLLLRQVDQPAKIVSKMEGLKSPPILEISDGQGNLVPDAIFRVIATMCYHDDPGQRQRTFETLDLKARYDGAGPVSEDLLSLVQDLAVEAESTISGLAGSGHGIWVAGDLLLLILSAATYSPRDASLARAIRVWCRDHALRRTVGGYYIPASERDVRAAWKRFKPVAHLCAALHVNFDPLEVEKSTLLTDLPSFLAIAEKYRVFGENHHPPGGRTGSKPLARTTLDSLETWHLPPDLKLPTVETPIPTLTPFTLQILREYKVDLK
jgi:hypothetical protein